ncbi:MAG: adenylate/guanylate cyclase domain-containing protein, partial [Alphaproteobacteria bacterium]|nr:adenylate/guanylate cyclase domain-containing protein [Alphaproteobacteria bacterium]
MAHCLKNGIQGLIAWAGDERAIVAVAFTDIRNSTARGDVLGNESWHELVERHFSESARFTEQHNGFGISNLGDGEMLVFRTVEAALDYALALHGNPGVPDIEIRVGIHVGAIRVLADNIRGGAINYASRVNSATKAAEIWVSTRALELLLEEQAARHRELRWQQHPDIELRGLGTHTLWSVSPTGPTLAEIADELRRTRTQRPTAEAAA